jgi:hypothetical protein
LNGGHRTCVPQEESLAAVIDLIRDWLAANPKQGRLGIVLGAGLALKGRYPCREAAEMYDASAAPAVRIGARRGT